MKDIYVEFNDGDIIGDSRNPEHRGAVEATEFVQRIAPESSSPGAPAHRPEFDDLIFRKDIDRATPSLFAAYAAGRVIKDIKVHFYRIEPGAMGFPIRRRSYVLTLRDSIVSSVTRTSDLRVPAETFTLKCAAMEWRYEIVRDAAFKMARG